MAKVSLSSQEIGLSLIPVFKRLADALLWVYQHEGKITIEVPDTYGLEYDGKPWGYKCGHLVTPVDRGLVALYLAVLTAMKEEGVQLRKAKGASKRRR